MRRSQRPILIVSRKSDLARRQAEMVANALGKQHPQVRITHRWVMSEADQAPNADLSKVGGKGLFTRAIDDDVLSETADLAVHSMKDLPVELPPGITVAAVPRRADVRDCLIGPDGPMTLEELSAGTVVGTSSPRRAAQIKMHRPDVEVKAIRGNVPTRLAKVRDAKSGYDAVLLAAAGLQRLGLCEEAAMPLPVEQMMPAAAQGALALHCRATDHVTLMRTLPLNHAASSVAVHAERQILAGLHASCHSAIAVLAEPAPSPTPAKRNADAHWFRLRVSVYALDGQQALHVDETVRIGSLNRLVKKTIRSLIDRGAKQLLGNTLNA